MFTQAIKILSIIPVLVTSYIMALAVYQLFLDTDFGRIDVRSELYRLRVSLQPYLFSAYGYDYLGGIRSWLNKVLFFQNISMFQRVCGALWTLFVPVWSAFLSIFLMYPVVPLFSLVLVSLQLYRWFRYNFNLNRALEVFNRRVSATPQDMGAINVASGAVRSIESQKIEFPFALLFFFFISMFVHPYIGALIMACVHPQLRRAFFVQFLCAYFHFAFRVYRGFTNGVWSFESAPEFVSAGVQLPVQREPFKVSPDDFGFHNRGRTLSSGEHGILNTVRMMFPWKAEAQIAHALKGTPKPSLDEIVCGGKEVTLTEEEKKFFASQYSKPSTSDESKSDEPKQLPVSDQSESKTPIDNKPVSNEDPCSSQSDNASTIVKEAAHTATIRSLSSMNIAEIKERVKHSIPCYIELVHELYEMTLYVDTEQQCSTALTALDDYFRITEGCTISYLIANLDTEAKKFKKGNHQKAKTISSINAQRNQHHHAKKQVVNHGESMDPSQEYDEYEDVPSMGNFHTPGIVHTVDSETYAFAMMDLNAKVPYLQDGDMSMPSSLSHKENVSVIVQSRSQAGKAYHWDQRRSESNPEWDPDDDTYQIYILCDMSNSLIKGDFDVLRSPSKGLLSRAKHLPLTARDIYDLKKSEPILLYHDIYVTTEYTVDEAINAGFVSPLDTIKEANHQRVKPALKLAVHNESLGGTSGAPTHIQKIERDQGVTNVEFKALKQMKQNTKDETARKIEAFKAAIARAEVGTPLFNNMNRVLGQITKHYSSFSISKEANVGVDSFVCIRQPQFGYKIGDTFNLIGATFAINGHLVLLEHYKVSIREALERNPQFGYTMGDVFYEISDKAIQQILLLKPKNELMPTEIVATGVKSLKRSQLKSPQVKDTVGLYKAFDNQASQGPVTKLVHAENMNAFTHKCDTAAGDCGTFLVIKQCVAGVHFGTTTRDNYAIDASELISLFFPDEGGDSTSPKKIEVQVSSGAQQSAVEKFSAEARSRSPGLQSSTN